MPVLLINKVKWTENTEKVHLLWCQTVVDHWVSTSTQVKVSNRSCCFFVFKIQVILGFAHLIHIHTVYILYIYITDEDPNQETFKDEEPALPPDLDWLEELYE